MTTVEARNDYLSRVLAATITGMFSVGRDVALPMREALIMRSALLSVLAGTILEELGKLSDHDEVLFDEAFTILESSIAAGIAARKLGVQ